MHTPQESTTGEVINLAYQRVFRAVGTVFLLGVFAWVFLRISPNRTDMSIYF